MVWLFQNFFTEQLISRWFHRLLLERILKQLGWLQVIMNFLYHNWILPLQFELSHHNVKLEACIKVTFWCVFLGFFSQWSSYVDQKAQFCVCALHSELTGYYFLFISANKIRIWKKGVDSESFHPRFRSSEMRWRLRFDS